MRERTCGMGDNLGPKGLSEGCKVLLQIGIAEIRVHDADQPNAGSWYRAFGLPGRGRIDFLALQADASAGRDENVAVVEGLGDVRQAAVLAL